MEEQFMENEAVIENHLKDLLEFGREMLNLILAVRNKVSYR